MSDKSIVWILIILFLLVLRCQKDKTKDQVEIIEDLNEKDFQNFCLIYYDPFSLHAYEFDRLEGNTVICKLINRDNKTFYKPVGKL